MGETCRMSPQLQVSPVTTHQVYLRELRTPTTLWKNECASGTRRRQAVATVWQMDTCLDSAAYALESLRQS